ncbi:TMEM175 family protein [Methanobacterium sp. MBAC-LM]|jgi:uncharacterized membrane protein|uniref:TMEM175 family protein n=1 Tax=Methanobacterium sp. MBAC-LM TaxID=3412034 RepID=UPI003C715CAC
MEYRDSDLFMPTSRIETLVDGIFAIAMTILVLNLTVPSINGPVTSASFQSAVYSIWPDVLSFVLSFVLLGVFWNIHHRTFHQIEKVDKVLLWINMIWLLFIVLVPFSNTLTGGDYGQFPLAHFIFNLNMLGIAVFLSLNWFYAVRRGLIHKKVDPVRISIYKWVYMSFILITLLAMGLSFIIPHWSSIVYILIIPTEYLIERQMKS